MLTKIIEIQQRLKSFSPEKQIFFHYAFKKNHIWKFNGKSGLTFIKTFFENRYRNQFDSSLAKMKRYPKTAWLENELHFIRDSLVWSVTEKKNENSIIVFLANLSRLGYPEAIKNFTEFLDVLEKILKDDVIETMLDKYLPKQAQELKNTKKLQEANLKLQNKETEISLFSGF